MTIICKYLVFFLSCVVFILKLHMELLMGSLLEMNGKIIDGSLLIMMTQKIIDGLNLIING